MKILVAGDYCENLRVHDYVRNRHYSELFDDIKPIVLQHDFRIINFEFPIVTSKGYPISKCGPHLSGSKQSVEALQYVGFNICTLANNHILDQGSQCCLDTVELLNESGIKTVGAGKDLTVAGKTLCLSKGVEKLAIINCCEHEFSIATSDSVGANPLNPISQYYSIVDAKKRGFVVVVIVHGGHELFQLPSLRMKEIYRFFIDSGADAVINHHQHCYSGYEIYNGKPIVYGLGNFLFDHKIRRHSLWNEGYMVSINFSDTNVDFQLIPYSQCNATPSVSLMKGNELRLFEQTIEHLNSIILNDDDLKQQVEDFYNNCSKEIISIHSPYWGHRILNTLHRLHLLPQLMTNKRLYKLRNSIECESHRDKQIFVLKKYKC